MVIALGFFDSIHLGHQLLLVEGKKLAKELSTKLEVLTFDDRLYEFIPDHKKTPSEVFLFDERKAILESFGAEVTKLPTNKEFLSITYIEFLDYLSSLNPTAIVVGSDYTFGVRAEGNVKNLMEYFKGKNVIIKVFDLLKVSNEKVATTIIKGHIINGDMEQANKLMDREFFISGEVVLGRQVGKKIGIPTANINLPKHKIIPQAGVYVTKTEIEGKIYKSITNVGSHPTYNDENINIETHIIDFDDDIYNKHIKVIFCKLIRGVKAFNSEKELVEQVKKDIQEVKRYD